MTAKDNSRTHLRVSELAKKMGVSPGAIRLWMKNKTIPYLKINKVILLEEAEVRRALNRYKTAEIKPKEAATK